MPCQRRARSLRRTSFRSVSGSRVAVPLAVTGPFLPPGPVLPRVMRKPRRQKEEQTMKKSERQDVYTRITAQIIALLE